MFFSKRKTLKKRRNGIKNIWDFKWIHKEAPFGGKIFTTKMPRHNGSPFKEESNYFEPSKKDFMFNYRVANLEHLLADLRKEGVVILGNSESFSYGKFAWILDLDGNKIELWEPNDEHFEDLTERLY